MVHSLVSGLLRYSRWMTSNAKLEDSERQFTKPMGGVAVGCHLMTHYDNDSNPSENTVLIFVT